ncbi:hypothetical protein TNCV_3592551 [Trichonephila clavipes]|nr:hypothetical protein TNCV_3592551 [Trichonephila clavipes]
MYSSKPNFSDPDLLVLARSVNKQNGTSVVNSARASFQKSPFLLSLADAHDKSNLPKSSSNFLTMPRKTPLLSLGLVNFEDADASFEVCHTSALSPYQDPTSKSLIPLRKKGRPRKTFPDP